MDKNYKKQGLLAFYIKNHDKLGRPGLRTSVKASKSPKETNEERRQRIEAENEIKKVNTTGNEIQKNSYTLAARIKNQMVDSEPPCFDIGCSISGGKTQKRRKHKRSTQKRKKARRTKRSTAQ